MEPLLSGPRNRITDVAGLRVGNAAVFLCSDDAAMLTGVALEVDGGRCI